MWFHMRFQSTDGRGQMSRLSSLSYGGAATAFVVLVPYKTPIQKDEKNQIRSNPYDLTAEP